MGLMQSSGPAILQPEVSYSALQMCCFVRLPPKSPFLKPTVPTARWVHPPRALTSAFAELLNGGHTNGNVEFYISALTYTFDTSKVCRRRLSGAWSHRRRWTAGLVGWLRRDARLVSQEALSRRLIDAHIRIAEAAARRSFCFRGSFL